MKTEKILDDIKETYAPYSEFSISELAKVDKLREEWVKSKDPEWLAFRENPKTQALFKQAAAAYKGCVRALSNDDGTLAQLDRAKLHVGKQWSLWFVRALGGDPDKVRKEVEKEVVRFAEVAGVPVDN